MNIDKLTRRGFFATLFGLTGCTFFRSGVAAGMTPRATEGPFYPTPAMRMPDVDNDLVKVLGLVEEAGGEVLTLKGKITDSDGTPRQGHRIEIWQCDLNGIYLHPGDSRNIQYDQGFQGFGHDITGEDGSYQFRTIKPGKYPGRTPHIHVKVFNGDTELLTTQFYVADNPDNQRDSLFRRMSDEQAASVSMVYSDNNNRTEATVDIQV
ncbi:MAG: protocatechuate 3,4-dioxygenase [Gammaproteobacteria bacterium]|nr:protocatechuate 3,4-dioxygenase [Gammaproteobacteria bacterium]